MKKILSLMVALIVATLSYAQSGLLATLSHNGEITTYYGASAFREAYDAATDGDVVTLSSGAFNAVNLEKAITIRGAGMGFNVETQAEPTILLGDFDINIPETAESRLTIEGIYHNESIKIACILKNATFLKDRFNDLECKNFSTHWCENLTMIHCKIFGTFHLGGDGCSASCINCFLFAPKSSGTFEFVNCVIETNGFPGKLLFKNCVLVSHNKYNYLSESSMAYNCVGIGNSSLFTKIPNSTNSIKTIEEVFKTYRINFDLFVCGANDEETFELTDEAKTTLLGLDGTQVGLYGGNMPFSATTTNPQITRCNVAAKSTADGKLSVDITVNVPE